MLWLKYHILYGVLPKYQNNEKLSFFKRWQLSRKPFVSCVGNTCATIQSDHTNGALICWQHIFLDPFLKDMGIGWHLCLLPRHMVSVIYDGAYICDRLVTDHDDVDDVIDSTKNYLYRYGYEIDVPITIHDLRKYPQDVNLPPEYKGFIFKASAYPYKDYLEIISKFFKMFTPYWQTALKGTTITLAVACIYYTALHYHRYDTTRLNIIRNWDHIQGQKKHVQNFLDVMGLCIEGRVSPSAFQSINLTPKEIRINLAPEFLFNKNKPILEKFFKQYSVIPVDVKMSPQKFVYLSISS